MTTLPNSFKRLEWISNKTLASLLPNLMMLNFGNSEYTPEMDNKTYAKGKSIEIRRANRRKAYEGPTLIKNGIIEKTETLAIETNPMDGYETSTDEEMFFMTGERGMKLYTERYIQPSVDNIAIAVNQYVANRYKKDVFYTYGSPGTPINSPATIGNATALMEKLTMPVRSGRKFLITNPDDGAALKNSMVNYFNPTFNKGIGERFFVEKVMGFEFESTSIAGRHTAGNASNTSIHPGPLTVKTDVTSGNTIVITGFASADADAFKAGDIITITGGSSAKIVAPGTYNNTNLDAQFTVQADAASVVDGAAFSATVTVNPEIIIDTSNPWYNLTAKLAAGAVVTCKASHNVNYMFCQGGFSYVMPRMSRLNVPECVISTDNDPRTNTGVSLRLSRDGDIDSGSNIMRLETILGAKFHGDFCIRLIS